MTKPTMELVEEFGFIRYRAGCVGHKSHEELNATSAALLSEIRQRLEERSEGFEEWVESYGLRNEPNYSAHTEADCRAAYETACPVDYIAIPAAAWHEQVEYEAECISLRQRLEAMEQREAQLESDLAGAAKCAFQYAAKVGELERDAAIGKWLMPHIQYGDAGDTTYGVMRYDFGPASMTPPTLREAIDAAMAEGEG